MSKSLIFRLLGLAAFFSIGILVYIFFGDQLTLQNIQESSAALQQFVQDNIVGAVIIYIIAYILVAAFSLPGATILTLLGGYLFGMRSVIFTVFGATIGATLAMLAVRYIIGDWAQKKFEKQLAVFNREFEKNGSWYLLFIRISPAFPFFIVNAVSGLTKVKVLQFIWTTGLGIIMGTAVYTYAGTTLLTIQSPADIVSTEILIMFVLLSIVALIPVATKKYQERKKLKTQSQ